VPLRLRRGSQSDRDRADRRVRALTVVLGVGALAGTTGLTAALASEGGSTGSTTPTSGPTVPPGTPDGGGPHGSHHRPVAHSGGS
jgi:hypothetical protein